MLLLHNVLFSGQSMRPYSARGDVMSAGPALWSDNQILLVRRFVPVWKTLMRGCVHPATRCGIRP